MTTRDEIAAKLNDFAYQKKNFGGFMMNKYAKRSHALWTGSSDKGVTELTILTTRDYGNYNVYSVGAFTLDGAVPPDLATELARRAERLADSANLRAAGYTYDDIEPLDSTRASDTAPFRALSIPDSGVYVLPIAHKATADDAPHWVAWVRAHEQLNIGVVHHP